MRMAERPLTPTLSPSDGQREKPAEAPKAEVPRVGKREFAWQPLTFGGVAAFARASLKRLLLIQLICAAVVTGTVIWFFEQAWLPMIFEAVRQMPSEGEIRSGRLEWRGESRQRLAGG